MGRLSLVYRVGRLSQVYRVGRLSLVHRVGRLSQLSRLGRPSGDMAHPSRYGFRAVTAVMSFSSKSGETVLKI